MWGCDNLGQYARATFDSNQNPRQKSKNERTYLSLLRTSYQQTCSTAQTTSHKEYLWQRRTASYWAALDVCSSSYCYYLWSKALKQLIWCNPVNHLWCHYCSNALQCISYCFNLVNSGINWNSIHWLKKLYRFYRQKKPRRWNKFISLSDCNRIGCILDTGHFKYYEIVAFWVKVDIMWAPDWFLYLKTFASLKQGDILLFLLLLRCSAPLFTLICGLIDDNAPRIYHWEDISAVLGMP